MKRFLVLVVASVLAVCLIAGALFLTRSEPCPFSLQVIPEHIEPSIAGQRCVFLVVVADEGRGSGEGDAVNISATAPGAAVTVDPQAITPRQVAEVTVIPDELTPDEASTGKTLTVIINGQRGGLEDTETVTVQVAKGEDLMGPTAAEMRDKFLPWLAANHPEFGITSETEWTGTIVKPDIMVVMYYLFFSDDWEMGVSWHVTIPPHNWARIYIRHRFTEVTPSYAFEISSWSEEGEPHAIDPKDAFAESVWR